MWTMLLVQTGIVALCMGKLMQVQTFNEAFRKETLALVLENQRISRHIETRLDEEEKRAADERKALLHQLATCLTR